MDLYPRAFVKYTKLSVEVLEGSGNLESCPTSEYPAIPRGGHDWGSIRHGIRVDVKRQYQGVYQNIPERKSVRTRESFVRPHSILSCL